MFRVDGSSFGSRVSFKEQSIIRRLAVELGYIPAGVDVFQLTEAERVELVQSRDDTEFLKDAFQMKMVYRM